MLQDAEHGEDSDDSDDDGDGRLEMGTLMARPAYNTLRLLLISYQSYHMITLSS